MRRVYPCTRIKPCEEYADLLVLKDEHYVGNLWGVRFSEIGAGLAGKSPKNGDPANETAVVCTVSRILLFISLVRFIFIRMQIAY